MSVYKDTKNNTWKVYYRFTDCRAKSTSLRSEAFQPNEKLLLGSGNSSTKWKPIWI